MDMDLFWNTPYSPSTPPPPPSKSENPFVRSFLSQMNRLFAVDVGPAESGFVIVEINEEKRVALPCYGTDICGSFENVKLLQIDERSLRRWLECCCENLKHNLFDVSEVIPDKLLFCRGEEELHLEWNDRCWGKLIVQLPSDLDKDSYVEIEKDGICLRVLQFQNEDLLHCKAAAVLRGCKVRCSSYGKSARTLMVYSIISTGDNLPFFEPINHTEILETFSMELLEPLTVQVEKSSSTLCQLGLSLFKTIAQHNKDLIISHGELYHYMEVFNGDRLHSYLRQPFPYHFGRSKTVIEIGKVYSGNFLILACSKSSFLNYGDVPLVAQYIMSKEDVGEKFKLADFVMRGLPEYLLDVFDVVCLFKDVKQCCALYKWLRKQTVQWFHDKDDNSKSQLLTVHDLMSKDGKHILSAPPLSHVHPEELDLFYRSLAKVVLSIFIDVNGGWEKFGKEAVFSYLKSEQQGDPEVSEITLVIYPKETKAIRAEFARLYVHDLCKHLHRQKYEKDISMFDFKTEPELFAFVCNHLIEKSICMADEYRFLRLWGQVHKQTVCRGGFCDRLAQTFVRTVEDKRQTLNSTLASRTAELFKECLCLWSIAKLECELESTFENGELVRYGSKQLNVIFPESTEVEDFLRSEEKSVIIFGKSSAKLSSLINGRLSKFVFSTVARHQNKSCLSITKRDEKIEKAAQLLEDRSIGNIGRFVKQYAPVVLPFWGALEVMKIWRFRKNSCFGCLPRDVALLISTLVRKNDDIGESAKKKIKKFVS